MRQIFSTRVYVAAIAASSSALTVLPWRPEIDARPLALRDSTLSFRAVTASGLVRPPIFFLADAGILAGLIPSDAFFGAPSVILMKLPWWEGLDEEGRWGRGR